MADLRERAKSQVECVSYEVAILAVQKSTVHSFSMAF